MNGNLPKVCMKNETGFTLYLQFVILSLLQSMQTKVKKAAGDCMTNGADLKDDLYR